MVGSCCTKKCLQILVKDLVRNIGKHEMRTSFWISAIRFLFLFLSSKILINKWTKAKSIHIREVYQKGSKPTKDMVLYQRHPILYTIYDFMGAPKEKKK